MQTQTRQWLFSAKADILILFIPVWLTWIAAFMLPKELLRTELSLLGWIVFILALDVSHVWSTVYRTYFDKQERAAHGKLLVSAPLAAFAVLMAVNMFWPSYFWRMMAYFALYHFVKQQYGFMMIYSSKVRLKARRFFTDKFVIYLSMLYPVFYWHFAAPRKFYWFQQGDFFNFGSLFTYLPSGVESAFWMSTNALFWMVMLFYVVQEVRLYRQVGAGIPWAKIIWMLSTAGNWYLGIVYFNSDIVFSVTNVVAHGVPYLALIFFYVEKKKLVVEKKTQWNIRRAGVNIFFMFLVIMVLAYFEEYFWDGLVNREKSEVFEVFFVFPFSELASSWGVALAVSLLSLPQVTHYIIDGFIWKNSKANPFLRSVLFCGLKGGFFCICLNNIYL